jgi:hypothetical protein
LSRSNSLSFSSPHSFWSDYIPNINYFITGCFSKNKKADDINGNEGLELEKIRKYKFIIDDDGINTVG